MIQKIARSHARGQWQLIYKIAISVVAFLSAFTLSELMPANQQTDALWNIGISLFVAGVVFIAQYLVDVERRMDSMEQTLDRHVEDTSTQLTEHAEATDQQLKVGFSKIHLATELFSLSDATQLDQSEMKWMTKLVRNSSKIATEAPPLVQEFATMEIARLSEYLTQLGNFADVAYEGEDRDWLLGLTAAARKIIQATSLTTVDAGGRSFIDGGLWGRDLGLRYLKLQRQAIRRGVKIQRIFIFNRPVTSTEEIKAVLRLHLEIGVEVRTLDAPEGSIMHGGLRDLVIFDEALSYQSTPASSAAGDRDPVIVNTTLVTSPKKVNDTCREFEDLWNAEQAMTAIIDDEKRVILTPAPRRPSEV